MASDDARTTIAIRSRNRAPRAMASNAGDAGTAERCVIRDLVSLPVRERMNLADLLR
jgi:hypothetical protein